MNSITVKLKGGVTVTLDKVINIVYNENKGFSVTMEEGKSHNINNADIESVEIK